MHWVWGALPDQPLLDGTWPFTEEGPVSESLPSGVTVAAPPGPESERLEGKIKAENYLSAVIGEQIANEFRIPVSWWFCFPSEQTSGEGEAMRSSGYSWFPRTDLGKPLSCFTA